MPDARPSPDDLVADLYATFGSAEAGHTVDQFRSLPQASQYRTLYALTRRHMPPGARVLDWGCGNGHFSFLLARLGAAVTAYSFEPEPAVFSLLAPQERQRITFVNGSSEDPSALPFEGASFDCAFSIGVLEHVRETGGTEAGSLREIRRVLKPGGRFVCYHLPNRYSYIEALQRARYRSTPNASTAGDYSLPWLYHAYRYTGADIEALCRDTGFTLAELRRYGALPRNMLARLPAALKRSRAATRAIDALDTALQVALSPVSQNYAFVAVRS